MRRDFLTRSSALRAIALGAVVAPLWVAWSATSCLLADPPPALLNVPPEVPLILKGSVAPPLGKNLTAWPPGGLKLTVPVQVIDPNQAYWLLVMRDYLTPNSAPLSTLVGGQNSPNSYWRSFSQIDPDAGFIESPIVPPIQIPNDPNCHTYWFFVGPSTGNPQVPSISPEQESTGDVVSAPSGYDVVSWTYDPSGGLGACAVYDAGVLADASDATDGGSDGLTIAVDSGP
jgi:hypothetical protein